MNPGEGRPELEAAHQRIAELERAIETRLRPGHKPPRGLLAVIVGAIVVTIGTIIGTSILLSMRDRPTPRALPPPLPLATPPAPLDPFEPTSWNGPLAGAIGGDDAEDFVVLFRQANGVELVAIDGTSFEPLWRRGPFTLEGSRASRYVKRAGDVVLLNDARDVRAFDLRTGEPLGTYRTSTEISELCPFESGAAKAYLGESPIGHGEILDLDKRALTPALPSQWEKLGCHGRSSTPSCEDRHVFPCETNRKVPSRVVSSVYATFEDETSRVSVGWSPQDGQAPYFGAFMDKKTNRVVWEGRLSAPEDASKERDFRYSYAGDKVILSYRTAAGPMRVLARGRDGGIAWSYTTGGEGTSLVGISGSATRLYLGFDSKLVILDAKDGHELRSIDGIPRSP